MKGKREIGLQISVNQLQIIQAAGAESIMNEFFQNCPESMIKHTVFLNLFFVAGTVPTA